MATAQEINREEAQRLLALSREARWAFPSSLGTPVPPGENAWVEQALAQQESFVSAVHFLRESGDEDEAVELAANVWRLWVLSRDPAGGVAFVATALDRGEGKPSRARALAVYGAGMLAFRQGDLEESTRRSEAALEVARAVDDPEALVLARVGLMRLAFADGDYGRAHSLATEARELARGLDPAFGQFPVHTLAQATRTTGDYDRAAELFQESLDLNRRIGDHGMVAVEQHNLGHVEGHRGNVDAAERYFAECAELGSTDDPYGAAMVHLNDAAVAFGRGDHDRAGKLLHRARSTLDEAGIEAADDDQFEIDWLGQQLARRSAP